MSFLADPLLLTPLPGETQHALDESRARPNVRADCRIVEHVQLTEWASRLEDGRQSLLCPTLWGPPRDVLPVDANRSLIDEMEARDASQ